MTEVGTTNRFWMGFFAVLLLLAGIALYSQYRSHQVFVEHQGEVLLSRQGVENLARNLDHILGEQERLLLGRAQTEIHDQIEREVRTAFMVVHAQVPRYADFHYSLTGEYIELGSALFGKGDQRLRQILFEDSDFEQRLALAVERIHSGADQSLRLALRQLQDNATQSLSLTAADRNLLARVMTLTTADVQTRFSQTMASIRLTGSAAGLGAGVAAGKFGSKLFAKGLSKTAGKTAVKAIGLGEGTATGAAIGTAILPGVGTLVGGAVGAVVAWVATDKIIVEVDEDLHRAEFEAELHQVIEEEQRRVVLTLQTAYSRLLKAIHTDNVNRLKGLRPVDLIRDSSEVTGKGMKEERVE